MQLFLSIWLCVIIILSFYKLKWGVALYLAYIILVPIVQINFAGIQIGENLINIIFIFSYVLYAKKYHVRTDWKPLIPFIFYYIATIVIMPFQKGVPFNIMLNSWRVSLMSTLFLPFVMWNVMSFDTTSIRLFRNTILLGITIAIGYGLFLTTTGGINPYILLMPFENDLTSYYEAENTGRIFGRISSVFMHPMKFALFIGVSFVYLFYIRKKINTIIIYTILFAVSIMALLCGVRSVLLALLFSAVYYFLLENNFKIFIITLIVGYISYTIISDIPELSSYLESMTDINNKKGDVVGSSADMRIEQLYGAIKIVTNNSLFGLGYDWTHYYQSIKGDHPICLAFESLILVIICNWGIIGFVIWAIMIIMYFRINKQIVKEDLVIVNALMIFYVAYSCITGEYGYMKFFLLFYVLMMGEYQNRKYDANI